MNDNNSSNIQRYRDTDDSNLSDILDNTDIQFK